MYTKTMKQFKELNDHRLSVRIPSSLWDVFCQRCAELEPLPVDPSLMVRTLMAEWVKARRQRTLPGVEP